MNKGYINRKLKSLIQRAGTRDLHDILSELNIQVYRVDKNRPLLRNANASYYKGKKQPRIYISRDCPDEIKPFVIAHEIGHAVLHDSEISHFGLSKKGDREEREADYFAIKLLNLKGEPEEGYTTADYAHLYGVCEDAVAYLFETNKDSTTER